MTGYQLVTSDDREFGTVVADIGDFLIVEHGALRKSRHALPKAFAHPVDAERIVRVTVSKSMIVDSPKVHDGALDERAIARHYGLAAGYEHPDTEGGGELRPDDPVEGAVVEGARHGITPPEQTRAEIREGRHDRSTPSVHGRSATAADPFGQTANR